MLPKKDEIYRHFKGNIYKVITLATHSETGERMVVYQALYGDFQVYCRPLDMFVSEVDHEKYPDIMQKFRFERVDDLISLDTSVNDRETVLPETVNEEKTDEEINAADPLILEFLDAGSVAERRNILTALHHKITDDMINILATVMDVVIEDGELEDRYRQLKTCLETKERYEIERKI